MGMTWAQVKKINDELTNGWKFNLQFFLYHNEKTVHMEIPQENGYIEAVLMFTENMINRWCGTGTYHIDLHITRWYPANTEGAYTSNGLGQWVNLGGEYPRRVFKKLTEKAKELTVEDILRIHDEKVTNYSGLYA